MTLEDHNKVIGIMHLVYGGFHALTMTFVALFFLPFLALASSDPKTPPGLALFFGALGLLMFVLALATGVPPILAGYAMLKRKRWARVMSIVAACIEALGMPFGTALCVYTMWFHFGVGEHFYRGGQTVANDRRRGSLHDASAYGWETQRTAQSSRPRDYVPPPQPPDWRGQ